jgi:tRNA A37 methylthiotransferase MiaB
MGLDAQRVYNYLISNSLLFTKNISDADLIIIMTCAFCKVEEEESIKAIKNVLKHKSKSSKIIVTGCLPKINPFILKKIDNFEIISPTELDKFDKIINAKFKISSISEPTEIKDKIQDFPFNYKNEIIIFRELIKQFLCEFKLNKFYLGRVIKRFSLEKNRILHKKKKEFYLVIERGCLGNCSYCGIKFAIGRLRSRHIKDIIKDFKKGLKDGYRIIYLVGEDTGAYGLDINTNFVRLIEEIVKIEGNYKIRILDLNSQWLIKYQSGLKKVFDKNSNKFDFIGLGVQSASNRILKLMNRRYDIQELKKVLFYLKSKLPQLKINVHLMVGFPTETKEDFEKTMDFIKEFNFTDLVITGYSERPNTVASNMKGKIDKKIIDRRIAELTKLKYSIIREMNKKSNNLIT